MLHVPLMFLPEWREFLSAHCLAERKKEFDDSSSLDVVEIAQVAWHASFQREQTPISNEIIDSVQRHWEVGRGKNLSAPRPKLKYSTLTLREKNLRFFYICTLLSVQRMVLSNSGASGSGKGSIVDYKSTQVSRLLSPQIFGLFISFSLPSKLNQPELKVGNKNCTQGT